MVRSRDKNAEGTASRGTASRTPTARAPDPLANSPSGRSNQPAPIESFPEGPLGNSSEHVKGKLDAGESQVAQEIGAIDVFDVKVVVIAPADWPSLIVTERIAAILEAVIPTPHLGVAHVERVIMTEMGGVIGIRNAAILPPAATVASNGLRSAACWAAALGRVVAALSRYAVAVPSLHVAALLSVRAVAVPSARAAAPLSVRAVALLSARCGVPSVRAAVVARVAPPGVFLRPFSSSFCANAGRVVPRSKNITAVLMTRLYFIGVASKLMSLLPLH